VSLFASPLDIDVDNEKDIEDRFTIDMPTLPCAHKVRLEMFNACTSGAVDAWRGWRSSHRRFPEWPVPYTGVLTMLEADIKNNQDFQSIARRLYKATLLCPACKGRQAGKALEHQGHANKDADNEDAEKTKKDVDKEDVEKTKKR
jgi:hypothetical protein